jgi:hypothetical protein
MYDGIACQIVQNFANVSEQEIALLEHQVAMTEPGSMESHLLYALRVSKCLPSLRKVETLASRWGVACSGAADTGLDAAKNSPHWATVRGFLIKLYREKFSELALYTVSTTIETASKRKSASAKQRVLDKGVASLVVAMRALNADFPDIRDEIKTCLDQIEQFKTAILNASAIEGSRK